jgi:hypothetical protein
MESISHEGWTIQTDSEKRCFGAVITDPCGNIYHQTRVCWENHHAARRSAQKFIQWYIKLGKETERRILQCTA